MIKKILLICFSCVAFSSLYATTLPLKTGRYIIDRYRNVEIDRFDYPYQIHYIDHDNGSLQLADGSSWQVVPMNEEAKSFYEMKQPITTALFPGTIFDLWQTGDILIFHKVVNRSSLLAYNATKDLLLDIQPIAAPTNSDLKIASITNTNDIKYSYSYNKKTNSLEQYQDNNWRTVIVLTDGSVWEGNPGKALLSWIAGDPIHVAKDTPWWSSNTHILMNFKPKRGNSYQTPYFNRLGVWRAG